MNEIEAEDNWCTGCRKENTGHTIDDCPEVDDDQFDWYDDQFDWYEDYDQSNWCHDGCCSSVYTCIICGKKAPDHRHMECPQRCSCGCRKSASKHCCMVCGEHDPEFTHVNCKKACGCRTKHAAPHTKATHVCPHCKHVGFIHKSGDCPRYVRPEPRYTTAKEWAGLLTNVGPKMVLQNGK